MPRSETTVMVVAVLATVLTHNLAIGVVVGVLTAMTLFAWRVAHLTDVERTVGTDADGAATATYRVTGQLFFASSNELYTQFDYAADPLRVVVDLSEARVWDASTVASLDAITTRYARRGTAVEIVGLDPASAERHARLTGRLADP